MTKNVWSRSVPVLFQLGLALMLAIVILIFGWATLTRVPTYGSSFSAEWQGGGSSSPFVLRASVAQSDNAFLTPGNSVRVNWQDGTLPSLRGTIDQVVIDQQQTTNLEILLEGQQSIPIGASATVRPLIGQSRAIQIFWQWLQGS